MTPPSEVIRQSDLLNELVLNRDTLEEIGRVEVLWMYPQAHRVLGFICKSGLLGNQKYAFQLSQIDALGDSGVITHAQPQKTEAEKVRQLESLIGLEIWSDEGNRLGKIIDCLFHLQTGEITHYLFVSSGWASLVGEIYQLPPSQIQSFGKRRVLVSESSASRFDLYRAGISQKLSQARDAFKEEAVQEWATISKRAESTTEQAKTRAQQLSQQFKQQFKQTTQVWNDQVKEKTQTWLEQAKEKSQILAERVRESTQALSEQIEEQLESLSVPDDRFPDDRFPDDRSFDFDSEEEFDLDDFDLEADWFEEPVAPPKAPPKASASANPPANLPANPPANPPAVPLNPFADLPVDLPAASSSDLPVDLPAQAPDTSDPPASSVPLPPLLPNLSPNLPPDNSPVDQSPLDDDDDPWI